MDLNCDLGEIPALRAVDLQLMDVVTSANIACGGHAGDEESMRAMVGAARRLGVVVGAHPGYPDRAGFGRVAMKMSHDAIVEEVGRQVGALVEIAKAEGAEVRHVKPHGALYHAAMQDRDVAMAVAAGAMRSAPGAVLVGQAGLPGVRWWREAGCAVWEEAFAERRYERDGTLRSRTLAGALIDDPALAAEQAVRIAKGLGAMAADGTVVPVSAQTICIHGDSPGAVGIAMSVRRALERAGVGVAAPSL